MDPKYKKMINLMKEKEKSRRPKGPKEAWSLYVLRCQDGSLYTGITNDLQRRFKMHREGRASRFTRTRRPVQLLYQEACGSRTQALIRECEVKAYPKRKKEELVTALTTNLQSKKGAKKKRNR